MTFGEQILQLALSLDSIAEPQLASLCRIIERYTQQTLGIDSTMVHRETLLDGRPALIRKALSGMTVENVEAIRNEQGAYSSSSALCYDRGKPIWLVSRDGEQRLESCESYADLWSGLRKLPGYRSHKEELGTEDPVKTSILVPLRRRQSNQVFGVANFRTHEHLEITEEAKTELLRLGQAISYLIRSSEAYTVLGKGTDKAIEQMEQRLERPQPSLTKPRVFVASSSHADKKVTDAIEAVLEDHDKLVDFTFWRRMDVPGNIMLQLMEVIGHCRYGIAYLSESHAEGGFVDNPNVVFEAGMFHGRASLLASSAAPWIAIREKDSPEPFFDIAQERILTVPRKKDGAIDEARFSKALASRLEAMIHSAET